MPSQFGGVEVAQNGSSSKFGGVPVAADDHSVFGIPENPVTDFLAGVGGSFAQHAVGAYDLLRKIPGADKILPDSSEFHKAIAQATPESTPAHVGRFIESAGEYLYPSSVASDITKGKSLVTRMAGQYAAGAATGAVQSGGDPTSSIVAGAAGAAGEPLGDLFSYAAGKLPERLYQSALKPTRAMMEENPRIVEAGLESNLPVSPESLAKISTGIQDLRSQINQGVQAHAGSMVDPQNVVAALDELRGLYANSANPQLSGGVKAIDDLKAQFLQAHSGGIPLDQAQQMKINTYRVLRNAYGDMKSAEVEGTKQLARGLKEQIETVFPEIAGLNRAQSEQLGLEDAMTRAVWRMENKDILPMAMGGGAVAGHLLGVGAPAGIVAKALDLPEVKSRIALALATKGVRNANQFISDRIGALTDAAQGGLIRARDPQGQLHEAPAGTALPEGWKAEP